jgi:hypothetical protein
MIEKFNFYDIYGYFLPGAAFLAILWTPFGLVRGKWPSSDLSSALIAAAIAYVLGHLVQNVITNAIPSRRTKGKERYPSDYFLDPNDSERPKPVKGKLAKIVESQFGLDLEVSKAGDQASYGDPTVTIDKIRNNAFLLARQILIQGNAVSYAEQFQGMYALTRGLFAVFALASAYWIGWFFASQRSRAFLYVAIILLSLSLPVLICISKLRDKIAPPEKKHVFELAYAWSGTVAFGLAGYVAGFLWHVSWRPGSILAFLAMVAFLASLRFKGAYDFFAARFASTVWRDYLAYSVKSRGSPEILAGEE